MSYLNKLNVDVIFEIIYTIDNLNDIINFGTITKKYYNILNNNKHLIFNKKMKSNQSKFKTIYFNKLIMILNKNNSSMNDKYLRDSSVKLNKLKNILKWYPINNDNNIVNINNDYIKKLDDIIYKLDNYCKDDKLKEFPVSINELKLCSSKIVDILFFPCEILFINNMSLLHGSFKSLFSVLSRFVDLNDFFLIVEYKMNCLYNLDKTLYNNIVKSHIEYGKYDDFHIRLFNIFYRIDKINFRDVFIQLYNKLIKITNKYKINTGVFTDIYTNDQLFLQYDMNYSSSEFEKLSELFLINLL